MSLNKLSLTTASTIYQKLKHSKFLKAGLVIFVFALMLWQLYKNYHEISTYEWNIDYPLLISSIVLSVIISFITATVWQLIIKEYEPSLPRHIYMKIWFQSLMAKYLPGGFWNMVGRVYLCREENIQNLAPIISVAIEIILFLLSQVIIISFGSIYFTPMEGLLSLSSVFQAGLVLFLILVGIMVTIHPKIFPRILSFVLRKPLETVVGIRIRINSLLIWLTSYILINIMGGIAFFIFIISIYHLPISRLPEIVIIVNFSFLVSFLVPFAPNGLGVREGLFTMFLSQFMPLPIAIVISLGLRLWSTIADLFSIGLGNLIFSSPLFFIHKKRTISETSD